MASSAGATDPLRELVLPKLEGVRRTARGYKALCPAHDDSDPSLDIDPGQTQPVVLTCRSAGCPPEEILAAIGLTWADVCAPRQQSDRPQAQAVAEYRYVDEHGAPLYLVKRYEPGFDGKAKSFAQYRPNGDKGIKGIRRVIYRLPEVLATIRDGRRVWIVEGEKDVDRLTALGEVATCNSGGTGNPWPRHYADWFHGGDVVIIADNDDAGHKHARHVAKLLGPVTKSLTVVRAAVERDKADVSDHLAAGYTLDELVPLDLDQEETENAEAEDEAEDPVEALIAELLGTADLDAIPAPEPVIIDTLYVDTVARIWGPSGSFKSFLTIDMAGCVGTGIAFHGRRTRQGLVVYIVAEGLRGVRKRVRAWEQYHGHEMNSVKFLPRPVQSKSPEWDVLIEACRRLRPILIVVDTQARVTVGVEENSATEMGIFVDKVERLRAASGACVLLVHHTGVDVSRGRGSTSVKGAMQSELGVSRKGKSARDTRVTLSTGKQKDDEELGDMEFKLRVIELDGEADELGRPITSVVLEPMDAAPPAEAEEGSAEHIAYLLDQHNIPRGIGRDRTQKACQDLGIPAGKMKLARIVEIRKNDLPPNLPYSPVGDSSHTSGAGDNESPDQTRPGQVEGSNGAGAPRPARPLPPSKGGGRRGSPAPEHIQKDGGKGICYGCDGPMTVLTEGQLWHYGREPNRCKQQYLEKYPEGTAPCRTCGEPMDLVEPSQTHHATCDPGASVANGAEVAHHGKTHLNGTGGTA